jgi:molybdopterin synthase catalytic subunit
MPYRRGYPCRLLVAGGIRIVGSSDDVAPDLIALTPDPLDAAVAIAFVTDRSAGGIAAFLGTTRGEQRADGVQLLALDYDAYPEMAAAQLHDLAARARVRWPVVRLALLHRTGRVALAEPSVVVVVSTPHRADAFDACRWLIDALKSDAAIWKKEVWADGSDSWVHPERPR